MPPEVTINYLAVLVAAISTMIVGSLWYSPLLLGKLWMKHSGVTEHEAKNTNMAKTYGIMFLGSLVMCFVMSHFIDYVGAKDASAGATAAIWLWLGFVVTVGVGGVLFEKKPWALYLINMGYQLVSMVIVGAILAVWQ